MNSILQALVVNENAVIGRGIDHALSGKRHVVNATLNGEEAIHSTGMDNVSGNTRSAIKTITSFFAAPFIALGYVIALPFIGLYQFAKLALEAYAKSRPAANGRSKKVMRRAKNVGLFFASPFIALAYIVAMPIVGLFMFARLAMEARANSRYASP